MIIQLEQNIIKKDKESIIEGINKYGYKAKEVNTQNASYLVCIGSKEIDIRRIEHLTGVKDIHHVNEDYKLVSSKWKTKRTTIDLGDDVFINNGDFTMMAGPCSIEGEEQVYGMV